MHPNRFIAFTAICSAVVIAGCGGSNSVSPSPAAGGTLGFTGSPTSSGNATSTATVPATGGVTVSTSDAGTGGTAVVPSGALPGGSTVDSSTQLAIIPAGVGFPGTFGGSSQMGVNGTSNSGVGVTTGGLTASNIALPVTPGSAGTLYTLTFPQGDIDTNARRAHPNILTIRELSFTGKFYVFTNPLRIVSPVPTNLAGTIPNNGQNAVGSHVTASFGPGNDGRSATLLINYGNGFALRQTRTITSSLANFTDLTYDRVSVPQTGVRLVSFTIGDL